jgi:hypothetical protein
MKSILNGIIIRGFKVQTCTEESVYRHDGYYCCQTDEAKNKNLRKTLSPEKTNEYGKDRGTHEKQSQTVIQKKVAHEKV